MKAARLGPAPDLVEFAGCSEAAARLDALYEELAEVLRYNANAGIRAVGRVAVTALASADLLTCLEMQIALLETARDVLKGEV